MTEFHSHARETGKSSSVLKEYIGQSRSVVVAMGASMLCSLLFSIYLARVYGPNVFGIIQLVLAIGAFLSQFLSFGSTQALTHFTAKFSALGDHVATRRILYISLFTTTILLIIPLAVMLYFPRATLGRIFAFSNRQPDVLIPAIVLGGALVYFTALMAALRGLSKYVLIQIFDGILKRLGWLVLLASLPLSIALWTLPTLLLPLILVMVIVHTRLTRPQASSSATDSLSIPTNKDVSVLARRYLKYALPLTLATFFAHTKGDLHTLFVGAFASTSEAGFFRIAISLAMPILVINSVANIAFLPIASRLTASGDRATMLHLANVIVGGLAVMVPPLIIFMAAFAGPLVTFLYGANYQPASVPLMVLCFGVAIQVILAPLNNILLATGRTRTKLLIEFIAFSVVLISSFLLIPRFQASGAALSFTLGLLTWNALLFYALRKWEGLRLSLGTKQLGLSSVCLTLIVSTRIAAEVVLPHQLLLQVITGLFVTGISLLFMIQQLPQQLIGTFSVIKIRK